MLFFEEYKSGNANVIEKEYTKKLFPVVTLNVNLLKDGENVGEWTVK